MSPVAALDDLCRRYGLTLDLDLGTVGVLLYGSDVSPRPIVWLWDNGDICVRHMPPRTVASIALEASRLGLLDPEALAAIRRHRDAMRGNDA